MSGFAHNFKQYINLPTGGLSYSSACWGSPLTSELLLLEHDQQITLSYFEYITTVVQRYFRLPVDILEMYISDIYYIWTGAQIADIQQNDDYQMTHMCNNCDAENTILLHFGDMEIKTINPYNNNIKKLFTIMNDTFSIEFERRKVKHNLDYGYQCLELKDQFTYLIYYISYLMTQASKLSFKGKDIKKKEWLDFFLSLKSQTIIRLFNEIKVFNSEIGIQTEADYVCPECNTLNDIEIYNDFVESIVGIKPFDETMEIKKIEMYKNNLQMLQLNMASIEDLQSLPFKDIETFGTALGSIEIVPKGLI